MLPYYDSRYSIPHQATKQYSTNTRKHQKQRNSPTTEKDLRNQDKDYEITLTFEQMICVLSMSTKWFLIIDIPETLKKKKKSTWEFFRL